jgi:hypothetical protein
MAIIVEHFKYEMNFSLEMDYIEQLHDMHVYVPKYCSVHGSCVRN